MKDTSQASKYLSWVLRHGAKEIGLSMSSDGFASISDLVKAADRDGKEMSADLIRRTAVEDDKGRFEIVDDRIRASYGHSMDVRLELEHQQPPNLLYHGTAERFLESIKEEGLKPKSRTHVHLTDDRHEATKVGKRHGDVCLITIRARDMHSDGINFYRPKSKTRLWLTDDVSPHYFDHIRTP